MSLPDAPLASPRALPSQFPNSEPVRLPAPGDSSQALDQTRPLDSRLGCGGSGCGTLDVGRGSGSVGSGSGSWSVGAGEGRSPPLRAAFTWPVQVHHLSALQGEGRGRGVPGPSDRPKGRDPTRVHVGHSVEAMAMAVFDAERAKDLLESS